MRKLAALAVVVASVLGSSGTRPAEAERGNDPNAARIKLQDAAVGLGALLSRETKADGMTLDREAKQIESSVKRVFVTPQEAFAQLVALVLERHAALRRQLVTHNGEWQAVVEDVRKTDSEAANAQSGAGLRTAADTLDAAQARAYAACRKSIALSVARVGRECTKAGFPFTYNGGTQDAPPHPVAYVEGSIPFFGGLFFGFGECDGRASLVMLDPTLGQATGAGESFVQFIGPNSPDLAGELRLTSAVDFPSPDRPAAIQFSGLATGDYVVRAGVLAGGNHVLLHSQVLTIPNWDPLDPAPPPVRSIADEAAALGISLNRYVKANGAAFLKEMKELAKLVVGRKLSPSEAFIGGTEAFANTQRLFRERQLAGIADYSGRLADLAATDPAAADREMSVGAGTSADVLDTYQRSAAALANRFAVKGALALNKACTTVGAPFSFVLRTARAPHPVAELLETVTSRDGELSAFATCEGALEVCVWDPRDDSIGIASVEVREIETGRKVLTRELTDADFDDEEIALVEAAGLTPGRAYSVRLVTGAVLPVLLDEATITVPVWGVFVPPPPPCTGTTVTATLNALAIPSPPLDRFSIGFVGDAVQNLSVSFNDSGEPTVKRVSFVVSAQTPIDLSGPDGSEMIVTLPSASTIVNAFLFDQVTFARTNVATGTYTFRNLRNLLQPSECSEVIVNGTTTDGRPITFRFTLRASDRTDQ